MPRFHFNVYDGVSLPDPVGRDLSDLSEARLEAFRLASELMQEGSTVRRLGGTWRMEVSDETGRIVFRLDLSTLFGLNAHGSRRSGALLGQPLGLQRLDTGVELPCVDRGLHEDAWIAARCWRKREILSRWRYRRDTLLDPYEDALDRGIASASHT